ncbi:MAG TPA: chemotaxis protein CheW [Verrucomicrobiae bacterium]|nr:chemotaxis protein CheW [Verrucomicrobiae bacterium]
MNKYIIFEVGNATYGVSTEQVRHVEMVDHVTVVPNANPAIDGVVFSRGQVIPALNLRTRFGFPRQPYDMRTRLVFVQLRHRVVGLIVDSAREFLAISDDMIRPIEQTLTGISGNYLKAVAEVKDRVILLLELEAVLDVDQLEPAPGDLPPAASEALTEAKA